MAVQNLLVKPHWNYKDVMEYVRCGKTKAYEIMAKVKRFYDGKIPNLSEYVKRDSVLNYLGTTIYHELYINQILEKGGNNYETLHERKV